MDTHHWHGFFGFERAANLATDQRNGFVLWSKPTKTVNGEAAIAGREFGVSDIFHQMFCGAMCC